MAYGDDIVACMGAIEFTLLNRPPTPSTSWTNGPTVVQGIVPRGSATPTWWPAAAWKNDNLWYAVTPWFVLFPGVGSTATNTRIALDRLMLHYKSIATGQWILLGSWRGDEFGWQGTFDFDLTTDRRVVPDFRNETSRARSYKLNGYPIHGGVSKVFLPAADVACIRATMLHQLILDNPGGTDDRASFVGGPEVGADYYPDTNFDASQFSVGWVPGSGSSSFRKSTSTQKVVGYAPIRPPGSTTGETSSWQSRFGVDSTTVTSASFLADPGPDPFTGTSTPAPTPTPAPAPAPAPAPSPVPSGVSRVGRKTSAAGNRNVLSKTIALPAITTTSLPAATVGTVYSTTLAATGAQPITWSFAGLPPGMTGAAGAINGTPTIPGSYSVLVTATNAAGLTSATLTLRVNAAATAAIAGAWASSLRSRKWGRK